MAAEWLWDAELDALVAASAEHVISTEVKSVAP